MLFVKKNEWLFAFREFCGKEEPTRSNSSVGRATKKVRRRTDPSPDIDDTIVDKNRQKIEDVGVDKMSYESMLMGTSLDVFSQEKMEEFVLHDGDVVTKLVEGISLITFFWSGS